MYKIVFTSFLVLLFSISTNSLGKENSSKSRSARNYIFFLDGKQISFKKAVEVIKKKKAYSIGGDYNPRRSILRYGEKARNGIGILKSIK